MSTKPRIIVFGSRGQLGSDLTRVLPSWSEVFAYDSDEVDITDFAQVEKKVSEINPDIIVNAAAYNNVEEAETRVLLAYRVNAIGPYNIARTAFLAEVPVLHVSTDYVFDGTKEVGYEENDKTCPLNVYGASKEAGEKLVRIANPKHWIIRTSALFGVSVGVGKGYNFVKRMMAQAKGAEEISVVSDQWTVPTYTLDLANGIAQLLKREASYGTYHLVSDGSTTWLHFSKEIFRIMGLSPQIREISTSESGTKINRPKRSILRNEKARGFGVTLPPWEDALRRYIMELR